MVRIKKSRKKNRNNTDMNNIDGEFRVEEIFKIAEKTQSSNKEINLQSLWTLDKSWNMFRRE